MDRKHLSFCWFCHVMAHIIIVIYGSGFLYLDGKRLSTVTEPWRTTPEWNMEVSRHASVYDFEE